MVETVQKVAPGFKKKKKKQNKTQLHLRYDLLGKLVNNIPEAALQSSFLGQSLDITEQDGDKIPREARCTDGGFLKFLIAQIRNQFPAVDNCNKRADLLGWVGSSSSSSNAGAEAH